MAGGVLSAKTYERVFSVINPQELKSICVLFTMTVLKVFNLQCDILSIDSKVDRGSSRKK